MNVSTRCTNVDTRCTDVDTRCTDVNTRCMSVGIRCTDANARCTNNKACFLTKTAMPLNFCFWFLSKAAELYQQKTKLK